MAHLLARLTGLGAVVLPKPGHRIDRDPESVLHVTTERGRVEVDVHAVLRGDASTDALEILPGRSGAWRVETRAYTCPWPRGFSFADDPDAVSPFLFVGPNDALIWIAGPLAREKVTPVERLKAEGQTIRAVADAGENARIDLDYVEDGEPWWQRRYALAFGEDAAIVVSGQARRAHEDVVRPVIDEIASAIAPYRPD